jgi:hypothetical protein
MTLLWDALNDGDVWECSLLSKMRPACMALADRFRVSHDGGSDRMCPRRADFGNGLYEALMSVMGTEEDFLRQRQMLSDDSDAL